MRFTKDTLSHLDYRTTVLGHEFCIRLGGTQKWIANTCYNGEWIIVEGPTRANVVFQVQDSIVCIRSAQQ